MHYRVRFSAAETRLLALAEPGAQYTRVEGDGDGATDIDLSLARMHGVIRRLRLAADRGGKDRDAFLSLAATLDDMLKRGPNPVPASATLRKGGSRRAGHGERANAERLFEEFSGNKAARAHAVDLPDNSAYLQVGKVDAILYTTNREGQVEHYRHDFARKSRPLLIASHDGKELRMIGGSFAFTARGIVDHDAKGNPIE